MSDTDTQRVLKDIASGNYRDSYVVYARRSTDEPESQKNSISYQKAENGRYARRERLPIAAATLPGFCTGGYISERHSAFKETNDMEFGEDGSVRYRVERPKFHRLASFLAAGRFKGVIFLCWDRASRNKGDELIIRKLMKQGVDIRFVLATYDDTSAGELHKDIDGMFAEHHSRVTREKVTGTIRESRKKGLCTYKAPAGFLNEGSMERKPHDPERKPHIHRLYEMADQTDWSLSDLRRWIIAQGFTMPPTRTRRTKEQMLEDEERDERRDMERRCRLPSVSQIHAILTNPFYAGWVRGNDGQWVKSASHEAIVSQALFDRVQQKLARRRTSIHYSKKLPLPFRGFLRCGSCDRIYTPYEQKGHIYFGARCDRACPNPRKSVNLAYVEEAARTAIDGLIFTDEDRARIDAVVNVGAAQIEERQAQERDAKDRRARKLREDLAYLDENRATLLRTGAYTAEALAADAARFRQELALLDAGPAVSASKVRATTMMAAKLSELLKMAQVGFELAVQDVKETYARLVLSELTLSGTTLNYRARDGFRMLGRPIFSDSAQTEWLSELVSHYDEISTAVDTLERWLADRADTSSPTS